MHCLLRSLSLCLCLPLLWTCKSGDENLPVSEPKASAPGALGLNDVSVFFPLHLVEGLAAMMPRLSDKPDAARFAPGQPAGPSDGMAFVPELVQSKVIGGVIKDFAAMQMTALRFDPCANALQAQTKIETCVPQLRIVWQNLQTSGAKFIGVPDAGLHAVYSLDVASFKQILETLRELHRRASLDTLNKALLPHPVIAAEGLKSPYLAGILGLVHRYARASKLSNVAVLRRSEDRFPTWEMTQFALQGNKLVEQMIPATKPQASVQRFRADNPVLSVMPAGDTGLQLTSPLAMPGMEHDAGEKDRLVKPFLSALTIENPLLHNPLSIDCASCHRSGTLLTPRLQAEKDGKLGAKTNGYVSRTWSLEASLPTDPFSLHVFSYYEKTPAISPRVVNETAEVLEFIARHY